MATDSITVGARATATQVVWAGSGPHLIQNTDLVNTVWIGDGNTIRPGDTSGVIPVEPNGSRGVDGQNDVFAVTLPGIKVVVNTLLGGMSSFRGITQGQGALSIPAVFSPNFNTANPLASPSPSWGILQNGLAYFFGLILSGGTITGPDYIINSSGAFFYTGPPAPGNLSVSIVPGLVSVADPEGNSALAGLTYYLSQSGKAVAVNTGQPFGSGGMAVYLAATQAGPWAATSALFSFAVDLAGTDVNVAIEGNDISIASGNSVSIPAGNLISQSGTAAKPTLITTDIWHNITVGMFGAGFSAGNPAPQYALEPTGIGTAGKLHLRGQVILTGATLAAAVICTLPFTFPVDSSWVTPNNLAGNALGSRIITTSVTGPGNVLCRVAGANGNFVLLDGIVSPLA